MESKSSSRKSQCCKKLVKKKGKSSPTMATIQVLQRRKTSASGSRKQAESEQPPATEQTETPKEKFTFFYASNSVFSQFYPRKFTAVPLYGGSQTPLDFQHCEQWMMYNKALLFGDMASAQTIISFHEPQRCKAIGRKVKNFDEKIWKEHRQAIVYHGNKHKFFQNPDLFQELKATAGTTLVEASPHDTIYGIGLDARNKNAQNRATWRGQNLLGEILTRLRNDIC